MPRIKLTQRADGFYRCKYHGKEFYGKTQAEALKMRDEYADAEKAGYNHSWDETVFLDYAAEWLNVYRSDCCTSQKKIYLGMVKYAADVLKRKYIRDITSTDLQALCNTLSMYSPSYVSKFMIIMRGIFRSAVADGALIRNPMETVKRPKTKPAEGHRTLEPWERNLIRRTYRDHDFGLCAMTMMYSGLRRGEALYLNIDRDVDFEKGVIYVRGAVSFTESNQPMITPGKTKAAQRTVPLMKPLADALRGHHGLLCCKEDGGYLSNTAFNKKYRSYITFLETELNGCHKRWYGKTKEHKALLAQGKELPPWKNITIRCHDFRVDFCTRAYQADIPIKTLQAWMGHADSAMILNIYAKLTQEQENRDALKMAAFIDTEDRNRSGSYSA